MARLLLILALVMLGQASSRAQGDQVDLIIENVRIVPMTDERILPDHAVAIRDGMIVAVAPSQDLSHLSAARRVDGAGRYLMPGLADMHVHTEDDVEGALRLFLVNGVTTVRNMNDRGVDHRAVRQAILDGEVIGPRYLVSTPAVTAENAPDALAATALIEGYALGGYDVVKMRGDLSLPAYEAVIATAARHGLAVGGHPQHGMPLSASLRMQSWEHAEEFLAVLTPAVLDDPDRAQRAAEEIAASATFVTLSMGIYEVIPRYVDESEFAHMRQAPLNVYLPAATREATFSDANFYRRRGWGPERVDAFRQNYARLELFVVRLQAAGARLLLGSDAAGALPQGFAVHHELQLMVQAGMTPFQALRAATVNPSAYLGEAGGVVTPGARADLVLVDGNPLADITAAARIRGVTVQGQWVSNHQLETWRREIRTEYAD